MFREYPCIGCHETEEEICKDCKKEVEYEKWIEEVVKLYPKDIASLIIAISQTDLALRYKQCLYNIIEKYIED